METPDGPLGKPAKECKENSTGLLNQRAGFRRKNSILAWGLSVASALRYNVQHTFPL